MATPLRVLIVEDSPDDAELMVMRLSSEDFQLQWTQVETEADYRAALAALPDLILADWSLPQFSGLAALRIMRDRELDIPFIIVSGSIGEEAAVEALRQGAYDYVLKDRPARLGSAVRRALAERQERAARRQAEIALRESEARYRAFVNATSDLVFIKDHQLRYLHVNEAMAAFLQRPPTEIAGRADADLLPPDLAAQCLASDRRALDAKTVVIAEEASGRRIFESTKFPVPLAAGRVGVGAVIRDITERKQAEEELHRAHEMLRTVLDTIPQRVYWKDRNLVYLGANRAYASDAGVADPGEIIGKRATDLIWSAYAEKFEAQERQVIAADAPLLGLEEQLTLPDRSSCWHRVNKAPLHDAKGAVIGVLGTYEDITEQKRAEEKLQRTLEDLAHSNAELERFGYIASHDLQEPLRMVSSFVQLLAERYRGRLDADADDFIGFVVDGAQRMGQLINDLLAYSRVGTRGQPLRPTDTEAALEDALWNLSVAIEETGATVTHDPLPVVLADRTQLLQLFQNLIGNALKFRGSEPPRVHVAAQAIADIRSAPDIVRRPADAAAASIAHPTSHIADRPTGWVFSVADNGIGIAPEYHERIFGVFQRLHSRSEYPGTGIGLAICKRVVERHGGRIWVESQVGRGATFYFTLPAAPEAA